MIKASIAQGRTEEALQNLEDWYKYIQTLENEFIAIQNRYSSLKDEKNSQTIDSSQADIRQNRINQAVLNFWEQIEHVSEALFPGKRVDISVESFKDQVQFKLLRQYTIQRQVAQGNTAIIYKARDIYSQQFVAIRALKKQDFTASSLSGQGHIKPFKNQIIQQLYTIRHRNIIQVLGTYLDTFPECIVLEYINGGTSLEKLLRLGKRPIHEVISYIMKLADALEYLHSKGIIHGKINSSKILIDLEQEPMISPFELFSTIYSLYGIEKFMEDLKYTSPEELSHASPTEKSDQYSLGVVGYQMLTGAPLFSGQNLPAIARKRDKYYQDEVYREEIWTEVDAPKELKEVIKKMIALAPGDRFSSLGEVIQSLEKIPVTLSNSQKIAMRSYKRACAKNMELVQDFYKKLFKTHPDFKTFFENQKTTEKKRYRMVRGAVSLLVATGENRHYLDRLSKLRFHQGLKPVEYSDFIQVLIDTIQENDHLWDEATSDSWQKIKERVMNVIRSNDL